MTKIAIAAALAAALLPANTSAEPAKLSVVAQSHGMIWNAVAVAKDRVFVAGPRWTGSTGPAVAMLDADGTLRPFPNAVWNSWRKGAPTEHVFVNVNALHLEPGGSLWVIDTGSPDFGGDPLLGGAKVVRIDTASGRIERIYPLGPEAALSGSYVDDIRIHGKHGYLTDAGRPGLIILDLATGDTRRVLNDALSTRAPADRRIIVAGHLLDGPDGKPLQVQSDPLELSPDGRWLYFGSLEGPWSRVETRDLDDASLSPEQLNAKVEPWADLPPIGGAVMDTNGDLYFTDLADSALKRRAADGTITTIVQDDRLHWVDAPFIDEHHAVWLPVPQLDWAPMFNGGVSKVVWPVELFHLPLGPLPK